MTFDLLGIFYDIFDLLDECEITWNLAAAAFAALAFALVWRLVLPERG